MKIDVRRLFELEGERRDFDFEIDMSQTEIWGRRPIASPVRIKGSIENKSSIVTLAYKAFVDLETVCDRCLTELDRAFTFPFEYTLVRELQDEDAQEYILVESDLFDLDDLCMTDVLLNLPLKFLCSEDCKGLCPVCGKNKNQFDCDCLNSQTDPRLSALKALMNQQ